MSVPITGDTYSRGGNRLRTGKPAATEGVDRFFTLSLDLLCTIRFDGYFQRLNPAWERTLGYTTAELLAVPYLEFIHPEDREATLAAARELADGADRVSFENRYHSRDGSYRWLHWSAAPCPEQGLIYAAAHDITDQKRTEGALRESEERFRLAAASTSDLIYEWDIRTGRVEWYGGIDNHLGFEPGEFSWTLLAWEQILHPEDRDRVMTAVERHLQAHEPFRDEYRVLRKDGSVLHWRDHGSAVWDEAGRPYRWIGAVTDITAQKQNWTALEEAESRLRRQNGALAELAGNRTLCQGDLEAATRQITGTAAHALEVERVSVWLYDEAQSLIRCTTLYQRSEDASTAGGELNAADFPAYFEALEAERTIAADDAATDPRTREFAEPYLAPLGITSMLDVPLRLRGRMVGVLCHEHVGPRRHWTLDEQNFACSMGDLVSIALEASERQRAEEALRASEEALRASEEALRVSEKRFRALIEKSWDAIALINADGRTVYASPSTTRILGYEPDELMGRPAAESVHPDDQPYLTNILTWLSQQPDATVTYQCRTRHKDGSWRWLEGSLTNLLHEPSVRAIVTNHRDITDNKRAEEILQTSERRFRALIEHSWDSVVLLSPDGVCLYASPAIVRTLGYTPEELFGRRLLELIHPDDRAEARELLERLLAEPGASRTNQCRILQKGGGCRWVEGSCTNLLHESSIQAIVCNHRDISDSKQARAALQESHAFLSAVTEGTTDAVFVKDLQGRYLMINSAGAAFLGKSPEEVVGKDDREFYTPETALPMMERDRKIMESGVTQTYEEVASAAGLTRTFLSTKGVYRDPSGTVIGLIGICRDITGRKLANEQLKATAVQLERSNRELQDFAYVASHDLQEPLRKIQAFGDRLQSKYGAALTDEGRDYLDRMHHAASRMRVLIHDLLSFSRVTTKAQPFVPTDLSLIAAEVVSDLEARIEETGGMVEVGALPTLPADPTQMRQLLQNLIGNALKFHREGVPPVVRVGCRASGRVHGDGQDRQDKRGEPFPFDHPVHPVHPCEFARTSDTLELTVSDNGIGFEEKYLDRIFAPFQRLHGRGEYEGTGIGLAICRKIVERHGGSITARSTPGGGAEFIITLPVRQEVKKGVPPEVPSLDRGGCSIPEGEEVSEHTAAVGHHSGG
jgi:PAS domain S-box-containing protein